MSRHRAALALLALLLLSAVGSAAAEPIQEGNVVLEFKGGFAPRTLPREQPVPITVTIDGSLRTTDGNQPPALQRLRIALNRHGILSTRGLPVCRQPLLQSTTTEAALARCRPALVGSGSFEATVFSTASVALPLRGRILAFNGRQGGRKVIFLHLYESAPVAATLILPLAISRAGDGELSTLLTARVPRIAGGTGSVTGIHLKLGRRYTYRGHGRAYLSASCAAPSDFHLALFSFARADFYLAGNRHLKVTVTRECRVR